MPFFIHEDRTKVKYLIVKQSTKKLLTKASVLITKFEIQVSYITRITQYGKAYCISTVIISLIGKGPQSGVA